MPAYLMRVHSIVGLFLSSTRLLNRLSQPFPALHQHSVSPFLFLSTAFFFRPSLLSNLLLFIRINHLQHHPRLSSLADSRHNLSSKKHLECWLGKGYLERDCSPHWLTHQSFHHRRHQSWACRAGMLPPQQIGRSFWQLHVWLSPHCSPANIILHC